MVRDMDLIRQILLRLEGETIPAGSYFIVDYSDPELEFEGFSNDAVIYNFNLLMEGGFIDRTNASQGMTAFSFRGLTWQGHDFLDAVRNPEVWSRTKSTAKRAGDIGLGLMVELAKAEGKRWLTEKLGIPLG